jgi:hypothetical protein
MLIKSSTSPSIYAIFESLFAVDQCGPVGTTIYNTTLHWHFHRRYYLQRQIFSTPILLRALMQVIIADTIICQVTIGHR